MERNNEARKITSKEGIKDMDIIYATEKDLDVISKMDKHIEKSQLLKLIQDRKVVIVKEKDLVIGWLRYGLIWDKIPFLNIIFILEEYRNKSVGYKMMN